MFVGPRDEAGPTVFLGVAVDGVECALDVPAGGVEGKACGDGVFHRVDELEEGGVGAPSMAEAGLRFGEDAVAVPGGGDLLDGETNPDLAEDFEEDEGAEAGEGDLGFRVFGFGAKPSSRGCGVCARGRRGSCRRRE